MTETFYRANTVVRAQFHRHPFLRTAEGEYLELDHEADAVTLVLHIDPESDCRRWLIPGNDMWAVGDEDLKTHLDAGSVTVTLLAVPIEAA